MSAKVILFRSLQPGAGKTHVAAGLAAWLRRHGYHAAPLSLQPPSGDPVQCPEGGSVNRSTAVLAEACGLPPASEFEAGWSGLDRLRDAFEVVLVECAADSGNPHNWPELWVRRESGQLVVDDFGALPLFDTDLLPAYAPDIAGLPLWRFGHGPRAGIISLPHLANFSDYALVRGADWLVEPGIGNYGVLFIPATDNAAVDGPWMAEQNLPAWLDAQRQAGARLVVSGWDYPGAERMETGALADHNVLSRIFGRRVPASLPAEETIDALADWIAGWSGRPALLHRYL